MRIGIMGAMTEEISSLKNELTHIKTDEIGKRQYCSGKLQGLDVVIVFSRWGKVASAITATTLINRFNISHLLFTGVAGAMAEYLNIGDVVIGKKLYQHDMDARPLFRKHEVPLTDKIFFEADEKLIVSAEIATTSFLKNVKSILTTNTLENFLIADPKVYVGKIGSGDMFINDQSKTTELRNDMPDILAVEMEGAAVAQVCSDHSIPAVIIRTISDKASHDAHIDFQRFIADIATVYSKEIIINLCKILQENNDDK